MTGCTTIKLSRYVSRP